jgi:hypothetical protein
MTIQTVTNQFAADVIAMSQKVDLIDFRPIACKILSEKLLPVERIVPAIMNYKKFLVIGVGLKASIVPNLEEDEVWHTLHLDTDFYQLVSWYLERSAGIRHFGYIGIRGVSKQGVNDKALLNHKYDRGRQLIKEYFVQDRFVQATACIGECKSGGSGCDIHIRNGILPISLPELETEKFLFLQEKLMEHRPPQAGFYMEIPFDLEAVNASVSNLLK